MPPRSEQVIAAIVTRQVPRGTLCARTLLADRHIDAGTCERRAAPQRFPVPALIALGLGFRAARGARRRDVERSAPRQGDGSRRPARRAPQNWSAVSSAS
jgi:hypothetical protein